LPAKTIGVATTISKTLIVRALFNTTGHFRLRFAGTVLKREVLFSGGYASTQIGAYCRHTSNVTSFVYKNYVTFDVIKGIISYGFKDYFKKVILWCFKV
jgi:hypothetical protein